MKTRTSSRIVVGKRNRQRIDIAFPEAACASVDIPLHAVRPASSGTDLATRFIPVRNTFEPEVGRQREHALAGKVRGDRERMFPSVSPGTLG